MAHFTYKIGTGGQGSDPLARAAHSTVIVAATHSDAVRQADEKRAEAIGSEQVTRACLVDEAGLVVWSRAIDRSA